LCALEVGSCHPIGRALGMHFEGGEKKDFVFRANSQIRKGPRVRSEKGGKPLI